jgi:2-oxoglutarate/2-oxoacid ferredoxin oxidoreductase subunit beta
MSAADIITGQPLRPEEYKSALKPVWCPGCGDFGVLNALAQVFSRLALRVDNTLVVSGIGCSSRLPGYLRSYGFNAVHWRALPIAIGAKLGNPELTVIAAGGDGDGFSIGTGHFPHACRRNVDLTYIMMDNNIYGLTKGQLSPTSPLEMVTTTTASGSQETPINPIALALGSQAGFIARAFSGDIKHLAEIIYQGVRYPGFAFIQVLSPCVTFVGKDQFLTIKEKLRYLDQDPEYNPADPAQAFRVALESDRIPVGVIFRSERPTYQDKLALLRKAAAGKSQRSLESLMELYCP